MDNPNQFRKLSPLAVSRSRKLRREMTQAERKLWKYLRQRQLADCYFRRQYPIGNYIADFVCTEHKLVIEVDGSQHASQHVYDHKRDTYLNSQGYRILRFWNIDVIKNMEGVVQIILENLQISADN